MSPGFRAIDFPRGIAAFGIASEPSLRTLTQMAHRKGTALKSSFASFGVSFEGSLRHLL